MVATAGPIETKSEPNKKLLKVSELNAAMVTHHFLKDRVRFDHGAI
jgi:hypothetical protein